jgi:hypothetical protein
MKYSQTLVLPVIGAAAICLGSIHATAAAPDEALVAHWTFDQLSPDGKSVPDACDGKHPGHLTAPAALADGKLGKAIQLLGPPGQVDVGDLGVRAPATIAFLFNTRELFGDRRILSQSSGPEDAAGALRFDGGQLEVFDGGQWRRLIKRGLRFDQWQHVAVVFDRDGNATGYLNGERKETAKSRFDFAGVEAAIAGKQLNKTGNPFIGRLDDFRVYNRALSADEIGGLCDGSK